MSSPYGKLPIFTKKTELRGSPELWVRYEYYGGCSLSHHKFILIIDRIIMSCETIKIRFNSEADQETNPNTTSNESRLHWVSFAWDFNLECSLSESKILLDRSIWFALTVKWLTPLTVCIEYHSVLCSFRVFTDNYFPSFNDIFIFSLFSGIVVFHNLITKCV